MVSKVSLLYYREALCCCQTANDRKILALPPEIDFKGTMIMVRIPADVPDGFNLYDYMS